MKKVVWRTPIHALSMPAQAPDLKAAARSLCVGFCPCAFRLPEKGLTVLRIAATSQEPSLPQGVAVTIIANADQTGAIPTAKGALPLPATVFISAVGNPAPAGRCPTKKNRRGQWFDEAL